MNDIIEAISCEKEIIQLKLLNVPKHPKMIAKIFSILKDEEINVDMISQVTVDDFVQIEITLDQEFQLKLNQAIMKLKDEFKQIQIYQIRKYAKVAVGGKLVETTPGLAAEVFDPAHCKLPAEAGCPGSVPDCLPAAFHCSFHCPPDPE